MIDLDLSHDEYDDFYDTLATDHVIDVGFTIYDADENPIDSLSKPMNAVLSGSITVDSTADISRSLECTILDPYGKLHFEGGSPAHGAIYADRMIGAHYRVYIPAWDTGLYSDPWVNVPVFRGPVSSFTRDGIQVTLEAQGKESWLMEPQYAKEGYTLKRRMRLDDAIEDVLSRKGERHFRLPDLGDVHIHNDHVVSATAQPWLIVNGGKHVEGMHVVVRKQNESSQEKKKGKHGETETRQNVPALIRLAPGNQRLRYDGRGALGTTHRTKNSHFVFADAEAARKTHRGPFLASLPSITFDPLEFRNHVIVIGGKAKGQGQIEAQAQLPAPHPLSPDSLSWHGEPRFLTNTIHADNLKTFVECKARAEDELQRVAQMGLDISFETLCLPTLEEGDRVTVAVHDWELDFYVNQFTLPLTAADLMSIGYTRHITKFARRGGTVFGPRGRLGKHHHKPGHHQPHKHRPGQDGGGN